MQTVVLGWPRSKLAERLLYASFTMRLLHLSLSLVLCSVACAVEDPVEDGWSEGGKLDDPTAGGVVPTHSPDVRVLDGFHALLDAARGKCLEAEDGDAAYSVGAIEKPFELSFISRKEDLARTLGIDPQLKVKYAGATLDPSVSFLDSFKQTSTATHLLVAARASYRVSNTRGVRLTPEAEKWLISDPRTFLHRCGNFYVNGVELEAQLFVLIRFEAHSDEAERSIRAELGIGGAATTALSLDGSIKSRLEQLAKRNDVTVEMRVLDRGFLADGGTSSLIGSLVESGLSRATFERIDSVRNAMLASVQGDVCRDGGHNVESCTDRSTTYATNTLRNAVPVRVDLRPYSRATNAPLGGPGSPHEALRELVEGANVYLRALSRLDARLEIARDEVGAFLAAPAANKAQFGIAPPAQPVYRLDALVDIATRYRDALDPARSDTSASRLRALITSCWTAAHEGAIEACATSDGSAPSALPEALAAEAEVEAYAAAGRIVPMRFSVAGVLRYEAGNDACARAGTRLPTLAEAQYLAIPIGFGELQRTNEERLRFAAWHSDKSQCDGTFPAFGNPPTGTPGTVCTHDTWISPHRTTTLCVPAGGPFEGLPSL